MDALPDLISFTSTGASDESLVRLGPLLGEIVDAAIAISGADFGNIQLIDPKTSHLKIVAQRGFPQWWLDFWNTVTAGRGVCGTALERSERVIVEDVEQSPIFLGMPALEMQRKARVRAGQSTPIVTRDGKTLGVFSTHYKTPHRLDERALQLLDLLARQAGDIITRAQSEEAANHAAAFNEALLSSVGEGLYTIDKDGLVTSMNPTAAELFGWTFTELRGKKMHDITHHHYRDGRSFPFSECAEFQVLMHGRPLRNYEDAFIRNDGSFFDVSYSISPFRDPNGNTSGLVVSFSDITERKRAEEMARLYEKAKELAQLAHHDALTGLPNRLLFSDRLDQSLDHAKRCGKRSATLILDLDRFKLINDTLGHAAGDRLLESVAQRCKHCVRAEDTVARLGGDEFGFVLHEIAHAQDAALVAEKILQQISAPIALDGREMAISGSIGISVYPDDGRIGGDLVKAADVAMYRAKRNGRESFEFYRAELTVEAEERLALELELPRALTRGELELHYQPQLDLATNAIIGVEALLRWTHPTRGAIAPAQIIHIAEESRFIDPLGEWILAAATRQAATWSRLGLPPMHVAINVSGRQLIGGRVVGMLQEALREAQLGSCHVLIDLEVTETVVASLDEVADILRQLRALGVSIALDDFGTGYSSLLRLKSLPIDILKIDRSLLRNIPQEPSDCAITSAVISLAHDLGLKVVAEGVEQREQLEFLRTCHCDAAQGFLICKPRQLSCRTSSSAHP